MRHFFHTLVARYARSHWHPDGRFDPTSDLGLPGPRQPPVASVCRKGGQGPRCPRASRPRRVARSLRRGSRDLASSEGLSVVPVWPSARELVDRSVMSPRAARRMLKSPSVRSKTNLILGEWRRAKLDGPRSLFSGEVPQQNIHRWIGTSHKYQARYFHLL